jgi:hypothetical protein
MSFAFLRQDRGEVFHVTPLQQQHLSNNSRHTDPNLTKSREGVPILIALPAASRFSPA